MLAGVFLQPLLTVLGVALGDLFALVMVWETFLTVSEVIILRRVGSATLSTASPCSYDPSPGVLAELP